MSIAKLERRVLDLKRERAELDDELIKTRAELAELRMIDCPSEPGWYLDATGRIAHLAQYDWGPSWEDGWGNPWDGNVGAELPALPMTRLVEA